MRKLTLFIACSLDGYIAKYNDDLSFLKLVEKEGEDYGYAAFVEQVDTLLLGRKTYDYVVNTIGAEHYDNGERAIYVVTRQNKAATGRTTFYNGNLKTLIEEIRSKEGKNIYCDGGAELIHALLQEDLIDEITVSIIPILLGDGIRLFKDGRPEQLLEFISAKTFDTGLVQLHYRRKR